MINYLFCFVSQLLVCLPRWISAGVFFKAFQTYARPGLQHVYKRKRNNHQAGACEVKIDTYFANMYGVFP